MRAHALPPHSKSYAVHYLYASDFLGYGDDMKPAARTRRPGRPALPANSAVRALAILGDRWTLLILRDAFLGVRRFGDFEARLGITPMVLARCDARRQRRAAPTTTSPRRASTPTRSR
jgi:hypothetical protein